jgi:hypothetical protein
MIWINQSCERDAKKDQLDLYCALLDNNSIITDTIKLPAKASVKETLSNSLGFAEPAGEFD